MSSAPPNFAEQFAAALQEMTRGASNGGDSELDDTDRMAALIDAASATFDVNDPRAVKAVFASQALALDVIFKDFIRRKFYTFDNMRVALKAQAQCRATFKSLDGFKNPPSRAEKIRTNRLLKARKRPHEQELERGSTSARLCAQ